MITYLEWINHLQTMHGYTDEYMHMLPGTTGGCVVQHDLDHDTPPGVGHRHLDRDDLGSIEEC